jgi:sensor histidine kinase regulating citrate/malate metabolism
MSQKALHVLEILLRVFPKQFCLKNSDRKGLHLPVKIGNGMKQETIDHLLKEDALVHNKTNESRSGHGLGYLIIKDLVRWIGGRIEIESETGKGTRVSVFIRPRKRSTSTPIG